MSISHFFGGWLGGALCMALLATSGPQLPASPAAALAQQAGAGETIQLSAAGMSSHRLPLTLSGLAPSAFADWDSETN